MSDKILIGGCDAGKVFLDPRYANRHGLIAGATGTGKTVTLQCLAEGFSDIGVPVFMADVKGDISGISQAGKPHPKVDERVKSIGIENYSQRAYPVAFWDLFGKKGTPIRSTVAEMGPQLISRLLDLNETQESVITLVFEFTDKEGMLLVDLADLRTTLEYLGNNSKELGTGYGVSKASINAILRRLLMLERQGGKKFFGEPALQLEDFMQTERDGRGVINVLAADTLIQSPRVYSTFLLWLLSEMFENLPELGDPEKPVMVFFFDGPPAVSRCAQGVTRKNRAGSAVNSLQRRRYLFYFPEPVRHSRQRTKPVGQPGATRAARLYPERAKGGTSCCSIFSRQPKTRHRDHHHRNGCG